MAESSKILITTLIGLFFFNLESSGNKESPVKESSLESLVKNKDLSKYSHKRGSILDLEKLSLDRIGQEGLGGFTINGKKIKEDMTLSVVDLAHNDFTEFPNIFNLNPLTLTILDLSYNKIKNIPDQIISLSQMNERHSGIRFGKSKLDLSNNKLTQISPAIGSFGHIDQLNLSNNKLQSLPQEIAELVNLESLDLSSNKLKIFPKQISEMIGLKSLNLSNNKLESLPQEISKMVNLKSLDLSNNRFKNVTTFIKNLGDLDYINLSGNPLDNGQLDKIKKTNPFLDINY